MSESWQPPPIADSTPTVTAQLEQFCKRGKGKESVEIARIGPFLTLLIAYYSDSVVPAQHSAMRHMYSAGNDTGETKTHSEPGGQITQRGRIIASSVHFGAGYFLFLFSLGFFPSLAHSLSLTCLCTCCLVCLMIALNLLLVFLFQLPVL